MFWCPCLKHCLDNLYSCYLSLLRPEDCLTVVRLEISFRKFLSYQSHVVVGQTTEPFAQEEMYTVPVPEVWKLSFFCLKMQHSNIYHILEKEVPLGDGCSEKRCPLGEGNIYLRELYYSPTA